MMTIAWPYLVWSQASPLVLLAFILFTSCVAYFVLRIWSSETTRLIDKDNKDKAADHRRAPVVETRVKSSEGGSRRTSTDGRRGSSFGPNVDPVMALEIKSLRESMLHAQATGDKELECMSSIILAEKCLSVSELERAIRSGMQALEVARSAQDRSMEGRANEILARIHLQLHQIDHASKYANQALNISKAIQNKKLEGEACAILVHCLLHCSESNKNQHGERRVVRPPSFNQLAAPPARQRHSLTSNSDRFQKSSTNARILRQAKIEENISRALSHSNEIDAFNSEMSNNGPNCNLFVRRSSF
ncbi:hypothetical protein GUITHDRAFT_109197 [Guillardia theta CCMP2712]|uniref:Uncharacterized protein n=2 Tax=Guillardia theta TaxID=55529 RepID=L1J904_GUITC|nr:hypothetical protein GUITHDRAFT_109197 [Guillardia theta CCMP2712]EKX44772.1 hypothetical protein GUITHDRAFT_109197 [Guillardia theta CCMP2712]|eukprot:XP_005831752.1 hypothetical protein GUITHDRAFT_109197 [Guillardia theta CCMP2712]